MRIRFGAKINLVLSAGLLLLAAVGWISLRSIDELAATGRNEAQVRQDLALLRLAISELRGAEAAHLRFILGGGEAALADVRSAGDNVLPQLRALEHSIDPVEQKRRIARLRALAEQRLEGIEAALAEHARAGRDAAGRMATGDAAGALDQEIARLSDIILLAESQRLHREQTAAANNAENSEFLIVWGTAFAIALLLWAMTIINAYQARRQTAEAALRASEAQMRLVTGAVPALIALLDPDRRFRFHNRAVERLLPGLPADLDGQRLDEVLPEPAAVVVRPRLEAALAGEAQYFSFSVPMPAGTPLELDASLIPRLDESGRIEGVYALVTDVTRLKEVERMKAAFLSTVSHELRTPLTSIRGSLGLVAGGAAGALPEAAKKLVEIARDNCERLVRLVNDILDSEKMASGKMSFSIRDMDLAATVRESARANEAYAAAYHVRLSVDAAYPARVEADPDRVQQVVTNLLSNACKFAPAGSEVEIAVRVADGRARVSVADRGPGIPEAFRDKLFQPFSQADGSDARLRGGTGLGLSISRAIVERLGGAIGCQPREGGGTVFWFELPERAGMVPPEPTSAREQA